MKISKFLEYSKYHNEDTINDILDKISKDGIGSLSESDKAILDNYSKSDKDVDELLKKSSLLEDRIKDIDDKINLSFKQDNWPITNRLQSEWFEVNNELLEIKLKLKYIYKLDI